MSCVHPGCRLCASGICPIPCAHLLPKSPLRASVEMAFLVAKMVRAPKLEPRKWISSPSVAGAPKLGGRAQTRAFSWGETETERKGNPWWLWTELWKREGNRESSYEFFLGIASESEKVFARILEEFFRCLNLPKRSVFSRQTNSNFLTLTLPLVFWNWELVHSLTKKCSWLWQSTLRYTNVYILYVTMWLMCEYLYYMYIYI